MLEKLRIEIDDVDEHIVELLAKRVEIVKKIGEYKKNNDIAVLDEERFKKVLKNVKDKAEKKAVSSEFICDIYKKIHSWMCEIENNHLKDDDTESNNFVCSNLKNLKPYPVPVFGDEWTLLNSNENHFFDYEDNDKINYYPHNWLALIETMSKFYKCEENEITITNGTESAIELIIKAFCEETDKVLICSPTFVLYQHSATCNNIDFVDVPLLKNNYQLDVENILNISKNEKIKIAFIPTPTAPLGNSLNQDDILKLIKEMPKTIFVIDEAYTEFTNNETFIKKIKNYKNIIVLRTLSKFFGMAGLRVGFAISSSKNIDAINIVKPVYPVSRLSIDRVLKVFNDKQKLSELLGNRQTIRDEVKRAAKELRQLPCVEKVFDSETNFYFVIFKDLQKALKALQEAKIVIQNASKQIENGARITIGTKEQNDKLIEVLSKI